jgi:hypothetical protein
MIYFIDATLTRATDWDYCDKIETLFTELVDDGDIIYVVGNVAFELKHLVTELGGDTTDEDIFDDMSRAWPLKECIYITCKRQYERSQYIKTIYTKTLLI